MAYEKESPYARVFDATQSPAYLEMLAARFGAGREPSPETRKVYMDLGCAQGQTILGLAPLYPQVDFVGIDFNGGHIEEAEEEASRLGLSNARFVQADFRALPSDLPAADYLVVRGIYSWLAADVRSALEEACARLAAPGALLKLHHIVRPGGLLRESVIQLMQAALPAGRSPEEGREFASLLAEEAPSFAGLFAGGKAALEAMLKEKDESWQHDLFNEDFAVENAHMVLGRFEEAGWRYLASSRLAQNFPAIQVSDRIAEHARTLGSLQAQTFLDHVTINGGRDDLLIRLPCGQGLAGYDTSLRYGLVVPESAVAEPFQTVRGQVLFTRDDCRQIISTLSKRPLSFAALCSEQPDIPSGQIVFWLDMLISAGRVGPFLPEEEAEATDRERLRSLNRERIAHGMKTFSRQTTTPLLAAEYGNCLVAGWFETLVLSKFERRHEAGARQEMLQTLHRAGMQFPGPDRKPAKNQLSALQRELDALEVNYVRRIDYWGIAV